MGQHQAESLHYKSSPLPELLELAQRSREEEPCKTEALHSGLQKGRVDTRALEKPDLTHLKEDQAPAKLLPVC